MLLWFCFVGHPNYDITDSSVPKNIQRKWLIELCMRYIREYVMPNKEVESIVQHVQELEDDNSSGFTCRISGCKKKFVGHSSRVR